jgi:phosphatidate cytidylyltransferase
MSSGGLGLRAITATVFVLVMLGGVFGGKIAFIVLFGFVGSMCLWEFMGLTFPEDTPQNFFRQTMGLGLGMLPYLWICSVNLGLMPAECQVPFALTFFPILFMPFVYELSQGNTTAFNQVGFIFLGVLYIGIPFALLNATAFLGGSFSNKAVLSLLLLTWTNDTAAYLVGSRFGRTQLFPKISPKKTWEGFLGGAIMSLIVAFSLQKVLKVYRWQDWIALTLIVVIFGAIGDLVESIFKRSKNIKDSGSLLPGHGGFMDRFDAFIFMLPFAAAYLFWIGYNK